jgi:hypothetical protein
VNGTCDYGGIMYSHCEDSALYGYCDADWAGGADDRKSTSGGCFFIGNNLISWFSKKQNCVALSTAEAEYIAAGSSCSQLVWMKQMLKQYDGILMKKLKTFHYSNVRTPWFKSNFQRVKTY